MSYQYMDNNIYRKQTESATIIHDSTALKNYFLVNGTYRQ